jgi:hypothetical protein
MSDETDLTRHAGFQDESRIQRLSPPNWLLENDEALQNVWMNGRTNPTLERLIDLEKHGNRIIFIEAPAYSVIQLDRQDPAITTTKTATSPNCKPTSTTKTSPSGARLKSASKSRTLAGSTGCTSTAKAHILSQWVAEKLAETPELFK